MWVQVTLALSDLCPAGGFPLPFSSISPLFTLSSLPAEKSLVLTWNKWAALAYTKECLKQSLCDELSNFLLMLILSISREGRKHCLGSHHRWILLAVYVAIIEDIGFSKIYDNYNYSYAHFYSTLWNVFIYIISFNLHKICVKKVVQALLSPFCSARNWGSDIFCKINTVFEMSRGKRKL